MGVGRFTHPEGLKWDNVTIKGAKMDENTAIPQETTEIDPERAKKLEFLKALNAVTADKLTCWQELYDLLKLLAIEALKDVHFRTPQLSVNASLFLYSLAVALEELPEEGDIQVIARRMNEVRVMDDTITGVTIYAEDQTEQQQSIDHLVRIIAAGQLLKKAEEVALVADAPVEAKMLH